MYLGAQIRSARAPRRRTLRGLGDGGCPSGEIIFPNISSIPAGWIRTVGTCAMPPPSAPAPSAPAATGPITVSPVISTQVSPQISPQFVQQFQPSGSPVAAGASMAPSIIPYPQAPQYQGRTYEKSVPQEYTPGTTQATFELPTGGGTIVQERAPSAPSDLPALMAPTEMPQISPAAKEGPNWALWAAVAAGGIAVVFLLMRKGKK